jgi:5'-3' exonuclease
MQVHLVDGTYELFRHYFAVPSSQDANGKEVGALGGVLQSVTMLLRDGATHVGVATDHVIESFRNQMWEGYKTGEGIDPALLSQFHPLEDALEAMGVAVWRMVELEADDGMASAAHLAAADPRVERILLCTPDKDLSQCVRDERIVQFDRRARTIRDADGVRDKFGVPPESIPDWLALVGDTADGFPGLRGWGAKSAAAVLDRYLHLEAIPSDAADWDVPVRGAARLAETLVADREHALLFRDLATLRTDAPLFASVDELAWNGPRPDFEACCRNLRAEGLHRRVQQLAAQRRPERPPERRSEADV